MSHLATSTFQPLNIAILTVSDTRTLETDTSGQTLADALLAAGHRLHQRSLKTDDTSTRSARWSRPGSPTPRYRSA